MRYIDRGLLIIHALAAAFFSLLGLAMSFGWLAPLDLLRTSLNDQYARLLFGVLGGIFLLISLRLLCTSTERISGKQAVVHETPLGQVKVSLHAIENLVKKVTRQIRGVRDVKAYVTIGSASEVNVQIRTTVSPEINIPTLTTEIQQTVKEYIFDVVGITVSSVKVFVDNISADVRTRIE